VYFEKKKNFAVDGTREEADALADQVANVVYDFCAGVWEKYVLFCLMAMIHA